MALNNLFGDGDEGEENCKISINKKYAEKYHKFKECQELDKLKEKYGDDAQMSSSSSESEDDDAEGLTPQIEQDFLQTLSMIKQKDPKIYSKDSVFFTPAEADDNSTGNGQTMKKSKEQPVFLKDYERKRLLEKGEKAYLSDSDDETGITLTKRGDGTTYIEEQNDLKKSLMDAAHSNEEESDDDLLQVRNDISEDAKKELEKPDPKLSTVTPKSALDRYWKSDDMDVGEKFLRDYILLKQFKEHRDPEHVPTYDEVVDDLDEDLDKEDEFERKFNFRYEDPDPEFIKQYPRTISESVRRKDDKRKQQRKERDERKKKEKEKKKEELNRLKNLKRKEIIEKIEKLKEITGNDKVGFLEEDMQNDFDMSKYDQLMEKVFDEQYYDENEDGEEVQKPVFSDEEEYFDEGNEIYDEDGNYIEDYTAEEGYEPHCEDPDFIMDADYVPKKKDPLDKKVRGRRGMSKKFMEAVQRQKPTFDPSQKSFEEYFDEYYKLDFEDIVDDIPVRFKYREVVPNDFGLSTDEVLKADDKELNEWCSLKNATRYLGDDEERKLQQKFKKKGRDKKKKNQVFTSLKDEPEKDGEEGGTKDVNMETIAKPRNLKTLHKKKKALIPSWNPSQRRSILSTVNRTKMKQIRNKFKGGSTKTVNKLSLQRLAAYGLDEKKNK